MLEGGIAWMWSMVWNTCAFFTLCLWTASLICFSYSISMRQIVVSFWYIYRGHCSSGSYLHAYEQQALCGILSWRLNALPTVMQKAKHKTKQKHLHLINALCSFVFKKIPILIKPFLHYSSASECKSLSEAVHKTISLIDQHGGIF